MAMAPTPTVVAPVTVFPDTGFQNTNFSNTKVPTTGALTTLEVGQKGVIESIEGGKAIVRKMLGLGIRKGAEINLLQKRRQGYVLANKGTRIALSDTMAKHLLISLEHAS